MCDAMRNVSSGICGHRRPRSACASAQSDLGIRCPQTESPDTTDRFNEEQMPGRDCAHVQDNMNLTFCACTKFLFDASDIICHK